jgi:predicted nucleic acid-binding protein
MPKPRIYFDANPLIDAIKFTITGDIEPQRRRNVEFTRALMEASRDGAIEIISSSMLLVECRRAHSETPADEATKELIKRVLTSDEVIKISYVTFGITEKARDLDWEHGISLRAADAIHLATAIEHNCKELISKDGGLMKKAAEIHKRFGIRVIASSDTTVLPPEYRAGKLFDGAPRPKAPKNRTAHRPNAAKGRK